jgi:hypothetical protein
MASSKTLALKSSMKKFAVTGEREEPVATPSVCSILSVADEVGGSQVVFEECYNIFIKVATK